MIGRRGTRLPSGDRPAAATAFGGSRFASTLIAPSTTARLTGSPARWAWVGALLGLLIGLAMFAPARWLAAAVTQATDGRLLLAEPAGTIWTGSAVPVLTGGAGSRDAAAPPGRLQWRLRPAGLGLRLELAHACCATTPFGLLWQPGWASQTVRVVPSAGQNASAAAAVDLGRWPTAWLIGLGTPWNSLQPGGSVQLSATGLAWQQTAGRVRQDGELTLVLESLSSRLSTLPVLGSYRLRLSPPPADAGGSLVQLETVSGPLQLSGQGAWNGRSLRFRGEARAAPGHETALANLLNIIGRRQGARSILSIG